MTLKEHVAAVERDRQIAKDAHDELIGMRTHEIVKSADILRPLLEGAQDIGVYGCTMDHVGYRFALRGRRGGIMVEVQSTDPDMICISQKDGRETVVRKLADPDGILRAVAEWMA